MDVNDINSHGLNIPCFLGVFLIADLKNLNIVKNNVALIVVHQGHAIAVHITKTNIEVMDPLGMSNKKIFSPICLFLKNHLPCKKLLINSKIQSDGSDHCAKYCLVYLYLRCNHLSFHKIMLLFSCETNNNDFRVDKLFARYFN